MSALPTEIQSFANISTTTAAFTLDGGKYGFTVIAGTWASGTVVLERLAADNSTYVTVESFSVNNFASVDVPSGTYKVAINSASGVYAEVKSVPLRMMAQNIIGL